MQALPAVVAWRGLRRWFFAALLVLPACVPYLSHYLGGWEGLPTGFIQEDQPGYMAVAREYFEQGFSWTYRNPFEPARESPAIYFQPQTFVLGLLWFLSRLDPGIVFAGFGLVAALVCGRVALALYEHCAGGWDLAARVGAVLFFWGGGFFVVSGALTSPLYTFQTGEAMLFGNLFRWDPIDGWWFLNFGRNLILPLESYYHALFFGAVLAFLRERYVVSGVLLLLLCASHPYSGSELLAVLAVVAAAEGFAFAPSARGRRFFGAVAAIGLLHVGYYLVFLPQFPEHRALVHQWSKWWVLDWRSALFGYGLVGLFALAGLFRGDALRSRERRLFLFWALVAFVLVKHELFTDHPIEPMHFTRGYVWTPLFFLGLPVLLRLLRTLLERRGVATKVGLAGLVFVFLLDNGVWLTAVGRGRLIQHVRVTPEQKEVFGVLNGEECAGRVVVTPEPEFALLLPVYTPLRPWSTLLRYTDGDVRRRDQVRGLFQRGESAAEWNGWKLAVALDRWSWDVADTAAARTLRALGGTQRRLFSNARYLVVLVEPAAAGETENPP